MNSENDRTRCIPSDSRPKSIGQRLRIRRIANGLKVQGAKPDGPHYLAMLEFLRRFVGTPHERPVYDVYFNWSRPTKEDLPLIDEAATAEGLTRKEYIAREVLVELRRFVRRMGIVDEGPTDAIPSPPAPRQTGYLDIAIDEAERIVKRGSKQKQLAPRLWKLFSTILASNKRGSKCPKASILNTWNDGMETNTAEKALSDLQKELKPLGLTIKTARDIGSEIVVND